MAAALAAAAFCFCLAARGLVAAACPSDEGAGWVGGTGEAGDEDAAESVAASAARGAGWSTEGGGGLPRTMVSCVPVTGGRGGIRLGSALAAVGDACLFLFVEGRGGRDEDAPVPEH